MKPSKGISAEAMRFKFCRHFATRLKVIIISEDNSSVNTNMMKEIAML